MTDTVEPISDADHVLNWLDDAKCHIENGTSEWCNSYIQEAARIIRAQDAEIERLKKALNGVILSWDSRCHEREQFMTYTHGGGTGWSPVASMVDSEAIANARAAIPTPKEMEDE